MTIELLYGRGTLGVTPPDGCVPTVIAKPVAEGMVCHADPGVAFVPEGPYVVPVHAHAIEMP